MDVSLKVWTNFFLFLRDDHVFDGMNLDYEPMEEETIGRINMSGFAFHYSQALHKL